MGGYIARKVQLYRSALSTSVVLILGVTGVSMRFRRVGLLALVALRIRFKNPHKSFTLAVLTYGATLHE